MTFSLSLANHIIDNHFPTYQIKTASYIRGRRLDVGEYSDGVYGVIGTTKDVVLRVPLSLEHATLYTQCSSRHLEEIFLQMH